MKLNLIRGRFVRRYKRFFADVLIDGELVTAHCPNTGRMTGFLEEGAWAWVEGNDNPKRKLKWTLVLCGLPDGGFALVDTSRPNAIVAQAIAAEKVAALAGYENLRQEVRYGQQNSRIDILLEGPGRRPCYVEVKNATLASSRVAGQCDFPDAPTERGRKHLEELSYVAQQGDRAVLFYLQSRSDCRQVGVAAGIDPAYAAALLEAKAAGVEIMAYGLNWTDEELLLGSEQPVCL